MFVIIHYLLQFTPSFRLCFSDSLTPADHFILNISSGAQSRGKVVEFYNRKICHSLHGSGHQAPIYSDPIFQHLECIDWHELVITAASLCQRLTEMYVVTRMKVTH